MKYTFNMTVLGNTFVVPSTVVDQYIKIATETQLKVLLVLMRNISQEIDSSKIADALSLPKSEVDDALLFWSQRELLNCEQVKEQDKKPVIINSTLPSRADVIKRGLEDENLKFLLREAQLKFGRNLKQNESQLLVSLYDDYDMKVSVILLLLGYAVREGKCNLSFVKKTATEWLENGIETVEDADELIAKQAKQNLAWSLVQNAFGIDRRKPSTKELELSNLWINEWEINVDLLKAAYDACIDSKTKLYMPYIAKIIEQWHKDGITSADQINKQPTSKPQSKNDYAGYNLDQYEKMLKEKIKERGN
jgi:DnaD/phage-associated family protein